LPVGSSHSSTRASATRQLGRTAARAGSHPDQVERQRHPPPALGGAEARQRERQLDVAFGAQHRQQVIRLEHEADMVRAPRRQRRVRHRVDSHAVEGDAAAVRPVDPGQQVQQGRLARTRGPHQRDEVAVAERQVHPVEHHHFLAAAREALADPIQGETRCTFHRPLLVTVQAFLRS
jgi:hypothetical protein